jgi:hypothetical protein
MFPRQPPLWFQAIGTLIVGLALRGLLALAGFDAAPADGVQLAFWQLIAAAVAWIWRAIEVAGQLTLKALAWAVHYLWLFARGAADVFRVFGRATVEGFRAAYRGLKVLYREVLAPAWRKFWDFVQWAQRALHKVLDPVLRVLEAIRRNILDFYSHYVAPVLDLIDVGRKVLRVLASFGIDWAKALDKRLADIQDAVNRPFQFLLAKVNEIVNIVDRVITADGLFQRLAFVKSLARDVGFAWITLTQGGTVKQTAEQKKQAREVWRARTPEAATRIVADSLESAGGKYASLHEEMAAQWEKYFAGV